MRSLYPEYLYQKLQDAVEPFLKMISLYIDVNTLCVIQTDQASGLLMNVLHRENVLFTADNRLALEEYYDHLILQGGGEGGRKPLVIEDTSKHPMARSLTPTINYGIKSFLAVPIVMRNGEVFGHLCALDVKDYPSRDEHMQIMESMAVLLANAVDAEKSAVLDELTGLYNRHFLKSYDADRSRKSRLAVVYINLNDFKKVNVTFGHDEGDLLLIQIAQRLKRCIRKSDIAARLRGDDFVVVLPDMIHRQEAAEVVKRLTGVFELPFAVGGHQLTITASIGLSLFPEDGDRFETLLKKAETVMGSAKQGVNRERLYPADEGDDRKKQNDAVYDPSFRFLFNHNPDPTYMIDQEGRFICVNSACTRVAGYTEEEFMGMAFMAIMCPQDLQRTIDHFKKALGGEPQQFEASIQHKDGGKIDLRITTLPIIENGVCAGVCGIAHDITEQVQLERSLSIVENDLIETIRYQNGMTFKYKEIDGRFIHTLSDGELLYRFGLTPDQVIGKELREFVAPDVAAMKAAYYRRAWESGEAVYYEGELAGITYLATLKPRKEDGKVVEVIAFCVDISDRKLAEEKINYLAYYDDLTGLPNRRKFQDELRKCLEGREGSWPMAAVMHLDLDRFKTINDSLGLHIGDDLLCNIAERLMKCVGQSGTVARMGDDEFTVLLPFIRDAEDAVAMAESLIRSFEQPFMLDGQEFSITSSITSSIGISQYPGDGEDAEALMKKAETAMHAAKEQGNTCKIYNSAMDETRYDNFVMENELRKALEREEFVVYYQPQFTIQTKEIVGIEALLRWNHPKKGIVVPGDFIPLAERTGLIGPIGEWTLRMVCKENKALQDAGYPLIPIAMNISMRQFLQKNFVDTVRTALEETGLQSVYLNLEITESMTMDEERAMSTLKELKALGVKISIDDFGMGYSSLSYLHKFPIDILKIDKSFIHNLEQTALVKTIISMAHNLNLNVIAEGVETEEQMNILEMLQCNEAQGFYYCKPLPMDELQRFMQDRVLQSTFLARYS
jgi:diguanylate cyclase (GGDEF)-like protein/PAS domain S-box-containing protein